MKLTLCLLVVCVICLGQLSKAEVKYLNEVMGKAKSGERKDLINLLAQLSMTPAKDPDPVFCKDYEATEPVFDFQSKKFKGCRVTQVPQGSMLQNLGLKPGQIIKAVARPSKGN